MKLISLSPLFFYQKYYFPPDLRKPNNLSVNYEKYISRDQTVDEHIDALLDALICIRDREEQQVYDAQTTSVEESKDSDKEKKDEIKPTSSTTQADFICYRGVLTKIMCTPYARNEPWELGATLYRGSIYIEEHVSQEKRENAAGSNDRHKLMSYWGYRFETICNISKPISELRTIKQIDPEDPELTGRLDGIVDTNLQYCTVARTRIGQNSVIMGAEVDCISEPKKALHNPLPSYIELKTSRVISNTREQNSFERHKLLKFWAQSFLPGIPTIIVGFRDDDGNVVKVETLKTMEIPRLVRGKEGAWDTTICINFLDAVFNFLRKMIVVDNPEVTYTIRWAYPFQAIQVEYMGKKNQFLTERFLKRWNCLT
ncbi:RAI1 like PD-XK nuclease-domain-containing protein [Gamsiella multidivaricata]|uniref:RAI1 like PD-XK nuclease-domain-containing protein n=1 Tax=Gamsiella multidivaricata TaxID=101098 RepID=UPI0022203B2B|nr:RAI1 like PD-XK nuclease-domain-containing protein [Gamsiella multidivaricata]KAI7817367.1 RAI1 like PD-XK nuclease-domain-containing protein [Gamsiella multidivaricata]